MSQSSPSSASAAKASASRTEIASYASRPIRLNCQLSRIMRYWRLMFWARCTVALIVFFSFILEVVFDPSTAFVRVGPAPITQNDETGDAPMSDTHPLHSSTPFAHSAIPASSSRWILSPPFQVMRLEPRPSELYQEPTIPDLHRPPRRIRA